MAFYLSRNDGAGVVCGCAPRCGPSVYGETITLTTSGVVACPCPASSAELINVTLPVVWAMTWSEESAAWISESAGAADLVACGSEEILFSGPFIASATCDGSDLIVVLGWIGTDPGVTIYTAIFSELGESKSNLIVCGDAGVYYGGGNGSI